MLRVATILCIILASEACRRPPSSTAADSTSAAPSAADTGRFLAEYEPADEDFQEFRSSLIAHRFLDTIVARLNDSLRIPRDITLRTAHCGEPNASYTPDDRRVTLCYELFRSLSEQFAGEPGGEFLVSGTVAFALMHELGHALIDVLDLPTTGREEDAVDQLATVLLLQQGPTGRFPGLRGGGVVCQRCAPEPARCAGVCGRPRFRPAAGVQHHLLDPWSRPSGLSRAGRGRLAPGASRGPLPAEYRRLAESWRRLLRPYRPPS